MPRALEPFGTAIRTRCFAAGPSVPVPSRMHVRPPLEALRRGAMPLLPRADGRAPLRHGSRALIGARHETRCRCRVFRGTVRRPPLGGASLFEGVASADPRHRTAPRHRRSFGLVAHRQLVLAQGHEQRPDARAGRHPGRHRRDPAPPLPRPRWPACWRQGGSATAPPRGWRARQTKFLAATDGAGPRAFDAMADAGRAAISGARPFVPVRARDAVLGTDGHGIQARIAKDERVPGFALNAAVARRACRAAVTHHRERPDRPGPFLHAAPRANRRRRPSPPAADGSPPATPQPRATATA